MTSKYIQYGCGFHAPKSWRNFDASPTLRFERIPLIGHIYSKNRQRFPCNVEYGDIVRGLPVSDESCMAAYCSHILEHLSLSDLRTALRNTWRTLQNDGLFRLVIPDLEASVRRYLDNPKKSACSDFLQETMLGRNDRPRGFSGMLVTILGNNEHLWMWDYKGIEQELIDAGFHDIRRAQFGDSKDPMFLQVEQEERWRDCLGVECRK